MKRTYIFSTYKNDLYKRILSNLKVHSETASILKNILLFFITALALGACTKESNLDPEGQWTLSNPAIVAPSNDASFILDETKPDSTITFTWSGATSSANYGVYYAVVIDTLGSTNFDSPILEIKSGNSGKDLTLSIKASVINEALSLAGYPANETAKVTWAVKASCLSKTTYATGDLSVKRFVDEILPSQLFISGDATENGSDLSQAIPMKRLTNDQGAPSNHYEVYTSLTKGKTYEFFGSKTLPAHRWGGTSGTLIKSGSAIQASDSGVFRISVNLDNYTYTLTKIDKFSVVGAIIDGGWGGDAALDYQGGGVWKKSIDLVSAGGFVFRANGDWGLLLKHVVGTDATLAMEADAASQGLKIEDIQSTAVGKEIVTLDLSAGAYNFSIVPDPTAAGPIPTPSQLFLLEGSTKICEFTKDGDTYTSNIFVPLQAASTYTLNTAADGSGTSYTISAAIGTTTSPAADKATGSSDLSVNNGTIAVDHDQAYKIVVNFATAKLNWQYYNMKLFHWSNWDTRDEFVMTYVHPLTFTVTADLVAGYEMKFNSPWDIQFSPDVVPGALTGTMTNINGGPNFKNIATSGKYKATIVVSNDFATGTYEFAAQ